MPSARSFFRYARQDQNQYYYDVQPPLQQYQQPQFPYQQPPPPQQPVHQAYQQQAVYAPPIYPQYWQQPVYQGYPHQWQQPPLQPPPVYYQQPQILQQQGSSQSESAKEYEPTMMELHWAAVEKELAKEDLARSKIRQQKLKEIADAEQLKREQEQSDFEFERLEKIMQRILEIKKEKLFVQDVPSKEDEVILAIEEPKGEEESVESVCIAEISTQISDSNISSLLPLQVSYPIEQITLNKDIAESVAQKEHEEDMMDEKLQLVPSKSIVDMPTTDFIFPPCLDISIKQNIVIICSFNLPSITYTVVSSHVQNFLIKEALDNKKVWNSLKMLKIHSPVVRAPKQMLNSGKLLDRWRTNWKIWKKYKRMFSDENYSLDIVQIQKSHSIFGWKPGWDSWLNVLRKRMKNTRRRVRKFDGVHPWAPNIW